MEKKDNRRKEIFKEFFEEVLALLKRVLEKEALEERKAYLEKHRETRGNGYYERSLATDIGTIEGLRVPGTGDGNFRPEVIPRTRKAFIFIGDLIPELFAAGLSTRKIATILERHCGRSVSAATISRLARITVEEVEKWKNRKLKPHYRCIWADAMFFNIKRDSVEKEPIYVIIGADTEGKREIPGYWIPGAVENQL